MGIPGLCRNITSSHPHICNHEIPNDISHFYIDFNPLIYNAISNNDITQTITNCINILNDLCNMVSPSTLLFIAVDGVAPMAKIIQQRDRGYKRHILNALFQNDGHITQMIKPGTEFMEQLSQALHNWGNNVATKHKHIIISDSHIPGEGEHKILDDIRMRYHQTTPMSHIAIYSNDGDFLVLAQSISLSYKTTLICDTNKSSVDAIKAYNTTYYTICGSSFCNILLNKLIPTNMTHIPKQAVLYDFMFFMSIAGNDFVKPLPTTKCRTHGVFNNLISLYRALLISHNNTMISLFPDGSYIVNYDMLCNFFKKLGSDDNEKQSFSQMKRSIKSQRHDNHEDASSSFSHINIYDKRHPLYNAYQSRYKYVYGCRDVASFKKRYYEYFQIRNVGRMIQDYLQSLFFTFEYYVCGVPSWYWHYRHPVAPFASDIDKYLSSSSSSPPMRFITKHAGYPLHPYTVLSIITPKEDHNAILPFRVPYVNNDIYPDPSSLWYWGLDEHKTIYSELRIKPWPTYHIKKMNSILSRIKHNRNKNITNHSLYNHEKVEEDEQHNITDADSS